MQASAAIIDTESPEYPSWVMLWFAADAILVLFPPIYWAVGGGDLWIGPLPASLLYFAVTAIFVAASVVAAYLAESRRGNFDDDDAVMVEESSC